MLKVFEKFCSALLEVSQICAAELIWSYMLLIVKTFVTPTGFKEVLVSPLDEFNVAYSLHQLKITVFSLTLEG